jgi:hypothetical protein
MWRGAREETPPPRLPSVIERQIRLHIAQVFSKYFFCRLVPAEHE